MTACDHAAARQVPGRYHEANQETKLKMHKSFIVICGIIENARHIFDKEELSSCLMLSYNFNRSCTRSSIL